MTEVPPLRLGTRASPLARLQAREGAEALQAQGRATQEVIISTRGDRDREHSLLAIGGQGVFVQEIEQALIESRIDVAVHSAKDMPSGLAAGTTLAGCLPRADVRDVLVSRDRRGLAELAAGARVGTGSRRRAAQLRARRPDLTIADIRGNVDTRLRKLEDGEYDAIVLAAAGLARLGRLAVVTEYFAIDVLVPSPGQGAIGLQARQSDDTTLAALRAIDHAPTSLAVRAERAMLGTLGAGCSLPVAALAQLRGDQLTMTGRVADIDGRRVIDAERTGAASDPEALGSALAEQLLAQGAAALLQEPVS